MTSTDDAPQVTNDAPPPPQPTPITENNEDTSPEHQHGPRATALQQIFSASLRTTLSRSTAPSDFSTCFPTPASRVPHLLTQFQHSFQTRLHEVCAAQFAALLSERDVLASLDGLDALIAAARERKREEEESAQREGREVRVPVLEQSLGPAELRGGMLGRYVAEAAVETLSELEPLQKRNQLLGRSIREQRKGVEALVGALEGVVGDLEGAVRALNGDDHAQGSDQVMEETVGEMRGVEEVLTGTETADGT